MSNANHIDFIFEKSIPKESQNIFFSAQQNPSGGDFIVEDLFLGDEFGDKIRPFQLELEKKFADAVAEVTYKKLIKSFLSKRRFQDGVENSGLISELVAGENFQQSIEFLLNTKSLRSETGKITKKQIQLVYDQLKNNGQIKGAEHFYDESEYQHYVETVKPYRKGFIKTDENGNYTWVFGWDRIENSLSNKVKELEEKINDSKFDIFNKIDQVDAKTGIKSLFRHLTRSGSQKTNSSELSEEYNNLIIAHSRCSNLLNKIDRFRTSNTPFSKEDFEVFTRYKLNSSDMVPISEFSEESQKIILAKLKEDGKEEKLPESIKIEYPSIEPPINSFIKKFNEWAKKSLLAIKSSGAKSFSSAIRKVSQVRFGNDASKLSDTLRITVEIDDPKDFEEVVKVIHKNNNIKNNNYYLENWKCEDSLFLSAKISIPITIDGVTRIAEVKFVEKNQLKNKDLCDELYHIRRRMKPEIYSELRKYIDVKSNPKETDAIYSEIEKFIEKNSKFASFLDLKAKDFYISDNNAQINFEALEKRLTKLEQLIQVSDVLEPDCNPKYRDFANKMRREKIEELSKKQGYEGMSLQEFDEITSQAANTNINIGFVAPAAVKQYQLN